MLKNLFGNVFLPLSWTFFIELLLCLPGNDLPAPDLSEIPNFDKIVHVIFFSLFVALWCIYFTHRWKDANRLKNVFFLVFLFALANGILIEYIQFYFIPMRSFDLGDIIADTLSAGIAYGICNVKLLSFGIKDLA